MEIISETSRYQIVETLCKNGNFTQHEVSNEQGRICEMRLFSNPPPDLRAFLLNNKQTFLQLSHPNVRRVVDIFQRENNLHVVLDHSSDQDLETLVLSKDFSDEKVALDLIRVICDTFSFLLQKGLLFSPFCLKDFVMIDGQIVFDVFGVTNKLCLAAHNEVPVFHYMAPEDIM